MNKLLCLTLLALCAMPSFVAAPDTLPPPNPPGVPPVPYEGDARPYADSPYAAHIDKAINYLYYDRTPDRWPALALLDFLQRKFGLDRRYTHANMFSPQMQALADTKDLSIMGRLVDPSHQYDPSAFKVDNWTFRAMVQVLYCDRFPLPDDFTRTLFDKIAALDKADRTPFENLEAAVLGRVLVWGAENGCVSADTPQFGEAREKLAAILRKILLDNGPTGMIGCQAITTLDYLGKRKLVDKDWLDALATTQLSNGGWSQSKTDRKNTDSHTTALALWALLEHSMPTAPKVPMIPQPPGGEGGGENAAPPSSE